MPAKHNSPILAVVQKLSCFSQTEKLKRERSIYIMFYDISINHLDLT